MDKDFPTILRNFIEETNLSQAEFARRVGVKPSQVSEWLHGKAKPGYDTLKDIALAFGLSADYFLGITDNYK